MNRLLIPPNDERFLGSKRALGSALNVQNSPSQIDSHSSFHSPFFSSFLLTSFSTLSFFPSVYPYLFTYLYISSITFSSLLFPYSSLYLSLSLFFTPLSFSSLLFSVFAYNIICCKDFTFPLHQQFKSINFCFVR